MKLQKIIGTTIVITALIATLSACQPEPGPAEKAGQSIDNATEKAGQKIEKAGDDIQDAAKGKK